MHLVGWAAPEASNPVRKHNYKVIQYDSLAMGVVNAASVFMPVFLVRLGGSDLQVGLLTALPALTAFLFAIPIASFLQRRHNVVPWYARSRGSAQLVYAATAVAVAVAPPAEAVLVTLVLWAAVTVPSALGAVAFNVVMDGAAGPRGRYDLLSMRWSVMGLSTAVTVALAGQLLGAIGFPLNYQLVFFTFSVAGLFSLYFSSQIKVPDHPPMPRQPDIGGRERLHEFVGLFRRERPFMSFVGRHFVLTFGYRLAAPLIPLWYVREAHAPDSWIGFIGTGQSLALLIGYSFWRTQSRRRSPRLLVLASTVGLALYPAALSLSTDLVAIVVITAVAALFSSGVDLVLFDELMKTIPRGFGLTFSAVETSSQNLAAIIGPLLGGVVAETAGIGSGLMLATVLTLVGAIMLTLIPSRGAPATIPAEPVGPTKPVGPAELSGPAAPVGSAAPVGPAETVAPQPAATESVSGSAGGV